MKPDDPPADYRKKRTSDQQEQGINDPMMPVAWVKSYTGTQGKTARVFTTTMGAAQDLENEGLRRLLVNACYWVLGLEDKTPEKTNVGLVGDYKPLPFKFGGFAKGIRPSELLSH
jgi:hypothetical protein